MNRKVILTAVCIIFSIFLCSQIFLNPKNQDTTWTYPYYSGAANHSKILDWRVSLSDYENVKKLNYLDYRKYKHKRTDDLIEYTANDYGFVLIAFTSRHLFPFLGDLQGTVFLQLIIHTLVSLFFILFVLKSRFNKACFFFLYAVNPIVIHFVTFPFYYYWMFLPAFSLSVLLIKKNWAFRWFLIMISFIFLSLLIRPTTIFLSILFFILSIYYASTYFKKFIVITLSLVVLISIVRINSDSKRSFWHTVYVGIGAYDNEFNIKSLSDNEGYKFYYEKSGLVVNTDLSSGNWNDFRFRSKYNMRLKERYFEILFTNPFLLIRNAVLNILQVFSIGYIVGSKFLQYINIITGLFLIFYLIKSGQIIWVISVLMSSIGFVFYFPPIPAYNFSAYLLIFLGLIFSFENAKKHSGIF
jgi:hypothetical protein